MGIMTMILPLAALVIALLIIAALWLWWSGDRADESQLQTESPGSDAGVAQPISTAAVEPPAMMAPEPAAPAPSAASIPHVMPGAAYTPQGDEILRIARSGDGRLSVTFGGGTYRTMGEMNDPTLRQQFMSTLRALALFTQDVENGVTAPDVPSLTVAEPQGQSQSVASSIASSPLGPEAELAETPPDSMAGQIESLLQARLHRTPGMHHRAIHIYGAPGGGVQISVDGTCFETVGEVPDPEARAMIEAAIRDWEAANPL